MMVLAASAYLYPVNNLLIFQIVAEEITDNRIASFSFKAYKLDKKV